MGDTSYKSLAVVLCFALATVLAAEPVVHFSLDQLHSYTTIMLLIDPDNGTIIDHSRGAAEYYQYPGLAGMNINQLNILSQEQIQAEMDRARLEARNYFQFRHRLASGELRDVQVSSYPMTYMGRTILVSRVLDATEQLRAERTVTRLTYFSLLILVILLVVLTVGFHRLRCTAKQQALSAKLVSRQLAEKELLLREVHHRVKNNVASIEQLLVLQLGQVEAPEAVAALQDAIGHIKLMNVLYDKLLKAGHYNGASVKEYVEGLLESIMAIFPNAKGISLRHDIQAMEVPAGMLFSIGIIVNELLTNILKYAFEPDAQAVVEVRLWRQDDVLHASIQDNGRGLPPGFTLDKATGFGLTIVRMVCEQYQGSFSLTNNKGSLASIRLPLARDPKA